jgi:hypothetical protein
VAQVSLLAVATALRIGPTRQSGQGRAGVITRRLEAAVHLARVVAAIMARSTGPPTGLTSPRKMVHRDRCGEPARHTRPAGPGRGGRAVPPDLAVDG